MRRADRLFQIVQYLRGGRLVTAAQLSEWLEVSRRTVYRDIADLQTSGIPIDGEAGVGYVLRGGFELPPLMFSQEEVVALVAGARLIRAWGGASMARAALQALDKIESVLPEGAQDQVQQVEIHAIAPQISSEARTRIDELQHAVQNRQQVEIDYADAEGKPSRRILRPLGLWYWGKVWTLVAWCNLRDDFRVFRVDRIAKLTPQEQTFAKEPDKSLQAFYARMHAECPSMDAEAQQD